MDTVILSTMCKLMNSILNPPELTNLRNRSTNSTSDWLKQQEIWSLYSPTRSATGRFDQKVAERPIIGRKVADQPVKWPRPKSGRPKNGLDVIYA